MQNTGYFTEFLIIILIVVALLIIYYYTRRYRKTRTTGDSYLQALEYLADRDYKRSIQKFKEAVRENTENINAYLRLGDLLRDRGLTSNALKIHRDLTLRSGISPDYMMKVYHSLMLDYEALGEIAKAKEMTLNLLTEENVYYREAANRLIGYLEAERQWEQAGQALKKYFKPIPAHMNKRMALYTIFQGLILQEEGEGRDARIRYKEALKTDPNCSAAYFYLGKSYYEEERLEDAVREWQTLCEKIPEQAYITFDSLEKAWFELGKFTEAERLYSDILATDSENIHAIIALTEIYNKKGDYDRALEILEHVNNSHPDDPRIISLQVQNLADKNQYKAAAGKALEYFDKNHLLSANKYFTCQECHFTIDEPLWICPQCKSIDSFNI